MYVGVWDVTTNEEAVEICLQHAESKDAILAASDVVFRARQQWEAIQVCVCVYVRVRVYVRVWG